MATKKSSSSTVMKKAGAKKSISQRTLKDKSFGIWRQADGYDGIGEGWFPVTFADEAIASQWLKALAEMSACACTFVLTFTMSADCYEVISCNSKKAKVDSEDAEKNWYEQTLAVKPYTGKSELTKASSGPYEEHLLHATIREICSFIFPGWNDWNGRFTDEEWLEELVRRTEAYFNNENYRNAGWQTWPEKPVCNIDDKGNIVVDGDTVGAYSFEGAKVESIVIPKGVTKIGKHAFDDCYRLEKVKLPSTLIEIGDYAFAGCRSLKKVTFPKSLRTIGDGAFKGCDGLKSVELPDGVEKIGHHAFDWKHYNSEKLVASIDVDRFSDWDWSKLLEAQPALANLRKHDVLLDISAQDWALALQKNPKLAGLCHCWDEFGIRCWGDLLAAQPQFADKCDKWAAFTGGSLLGLLVAQPQLIEQYRKAIN